MGSRDDKIMPPAKEKLFKGLRKRQIAKFTVEHRFHRGISAHHRIADHDQIRRWDILWSKALCDGDPFVSQKGGHGRINVVVLPADNKAVLAHRGSHRSHRRSANAQKMEMFERMVHKPRELLKA